MSKDIREQLLKVEEDKIKCYSTLLKIDYNLSLVRLFIAFNVMIHIYAGLMFVISLYRADTFLMFIFPLLFLLIYAYVGGRILRFFNQKNELIYLKNLVNKRLKLDCEMSQQCMSNLLLKNNLMSNELILKTKPIKINNIKSKKVGRPKKVELKLKPGIPPKLKKRGRPPKKRGRGRPKGSKNKLKVKK